MDRQNKILGIVGRKGSGKSTMLTALLVQVRRLLIFNTMGEHNWAPDQISDLDTLHNYMMNLQDPKEEFQCAYTPVGEVSDEFDVVANEAFDTGNMTFAIEELPMLTRSPAYMQPSLGRLFRLGRHRSLNLVWTAQRAAEVPRGVTGATDVFIFFQQTEPNDLKALEYRCGSECVAEVERLDLHGYLVFDVITRRIVTQGEIEEYLGSNQLFPSTVPVKAERRPLFKEAYG